MIVHKPVIVFVLSLVLTGFSACSPRALHEAQDLVRTADSLRAEGKMYGIDEGDSATLAQAYETLSPFVHRTLSPRTYSHACYHYGRLLREKDNPVAAMECFINASHARTRDYHILGRVYSNMGSICHLAGEYQLAYDMYERSANCFLADKDTLSYCFLLNDMAFELAEQGEKEEAFKILFPIEEMCADEDLLSKIFETKADAYLNTQQYDSAIYFAKMLLSKEMTERTGLVIIAQAYSLSDTKDSAVYYARKVLACSEELFDINNALYILTNDDDGVDKESLLQVASDRSDIQKELEIQQGKLAQAVQLLEQDLSKGFDLLKWILLVLIISGGISSIVFATRWRSHKRQMHTRISALAAERADNITQTIKNYIDARDIYQTLHWKDYSKMKSDVDLYMGGMASKLESRQLNEVEIRFCVLTMLDMSLRKIAKEIHYSYPSATKTLKKRISNKLGTTPPKLKEFLLRL